MNRKMFLAAFAALTAISAGTLLASDTKPSTVLHVITVKWKDGATQDQINAALRAAEALPSQHVGVLRVWTKPIKMQLPEGYRHIIVMEFESQDALNKYAGSAAQKKFYDAYMPIREESRTHDITN